MNRGINIERITKKFFIKKNKLCFRISKFFFGDIILFLRTKTLIIEIKSCISNYWFLRKEYRKNFEKAKNFNFSNVIFLVGIRFKRNFWKIFFLEKILNFNSVNLKKSVEETEGFNSLQEILDRYD